MFCDSHAHLDASQFDEDRALVLQRAADAGVRAIVNVGYNPATWPTTLALASVHPGLFACLGFHPNDAATWDDAMIATLAELHAHPKAVAVGETGLDYYRDAAPPERQRVAFEAQLALARALGKPIVIHHREARDDLLAILRAAVAAHGPLHGVLHAFNGGPAFAAELLALGLHLGIGGPVTFKNATALHDAVRALPLDRIVIETDSPYLAPHPHRGRRNESAFVALVAERIAVLKETDPASIAAATTENAARLFGVVIPDTLL
ncbi:MAG TPA: TatD family hydrolase [Thermomicrobiales bacterium]